MKIQKPVTIPASLGGAAAMLAISFAAVAQDADQGSVIEEVIVTAQKREQSLQSTPIAVTAFGQGDLDDINAVSVQDLNESVPTLHTSRNDNGAVQITLRGITSTNNTELGDPAVSFNIDGAYQARPQAAAALMFDVERVEILRGPQGTLFGRNSPAGAINLVSRKPGQEVDASLGVLTGNFGRYRVQGAANLPVSDTLSFRFSGMTEERDSFNNPGPNTPVPVGDDEMLDTVDDLAGRVAGLWTPTDNLSWMLTYDYFNSKGLPQQPSTGIRDDIRNIDVNGPSTFELDTRSIRSQLDWDFSDTVGLTYLASFNDLETTRNTSAQLGGGDQFADRNNDSSTHEIQLKSLDPSANLEWLLGAFYFEEENATDFQIFISGGFGLRFLQPKRTSEARALFGQATYHFSDALGLTVGVRQSEDEKEDVGGQNQICPGPGGARNLSNCFVPGPDNSRKRDWSAPTFRVQLDYDQDDIYYYGSIATGYKAGGFGDAGSPDYDEETLINYELGMKGDFFDGRLRLNSALFFSDYEDLQVTAIEGTGGQNAAAVTRNAAEADLSGLEVEFIYLPTDNSRIQGFFAYLDAELASFPGAVDSAFGSADEAFDASGNTLPFAPELSALIAYDVNFDMSSGGTLRPRLSVAWRDEYWLRVVNRPVDDLQESHTIVDASLRYTSASGAWSVELFGENLLDEEVAINASSVGAGGNSLLDYIYKPPRTYGIRFDLNWGG